MFRISQQAAAVSNKQMFHACIQEAVLHKYEAMGVMETTVRNIAPMADVLGRPDQSARLISDW